MTFRFRLPERGGAGEGCDAVPSQGVDSGCLPPPFELGRLSRVIGPGVSGSRRTFTASFWVRISGAEYCSGFSGTVRLVSGESGPIRITSLSPSDTFSLPPGERVDITVTMAVPDGNTYEGLDDHGGEVEH